ncbi:unnamed protein product, partial [marine sediment metagenome]
MFAELKTYEAQNGDCNVPKGSSEYRPLGTWVNSQRALYKKGKLSRERTRLLEGVGFDFYPDETAWDKMLADF